MKYLFNSGSLAFDPEDLVAVEADKSEGSWSNQQQDWRALGVLKGNVRVKLDMWYASAVEMLKDIKKS